jgi:hypothetical protein
MGVERPPLCSLSMGVRRGKKSAAERFNQICHVFCRKTSPKDSNKKIASSIRGKVMHAKTGLFALWVLALAITAACGGGGGSSGGGISSNSLIGSWVLERSNWSGASPALGFSPDGTGAFSGGSMTWTQQGNQGKVTSNLFVASVTLNGSTLSWADSNGMKATYKQE